MHGLAEIKRLNRDATNDPRRYKAALARVRSLLAEVVNAEGVIYAPGTITEAFAVATEALEDA